MGKKFSLVKSEFTEEYMNRAVLKIKQKLELGWPLSVTRQTVTGSYLKLFDKQSGSVIYKTAACQVGELHSTVG